MSTKKLARNIGSMSVAVLLSRVLGLLRDQLFAYFFGATATADAFNMAFCIPNLLRRLFGEGALGAAFIPLYKEIGIKKGQARQLEFGLQVLSLLTLFLTVLCLIGIVAAPLIVAIMAPGFSPQTTALTVKLTRILFPYLFLIGVSSTLIAVLNSHDYFFIPGLSSAFFNVGIIGALGGFALFVQADKTTLVVVLSLGVLAGGILQTVVNFPLLKKVGYTLNLRLKLGGEALTSLWKRFLPGVWGIAVRQVNLVVDQNLASRLIEGSISALYYGNRLMQLPLGVIGAAVGTAAIPDFSEHAAKNDWQGLSSKLRFALYTILWLMLPITAFIIITGRQLLVLLFMRGRFDAAALSMSYAALAWYTAGLVFFAASRTLTTVFYARGNTKTPVMVASSMVAINVGLNLVFIKVFPMVGLLPHAGLAAATSLSSLINCVVLYLIIKKRVPQISFAGMGRSAATVVINTALVCVPLWVLTKYWPVSLTFSGALVQLAALFALGLLLYLGLNLVIKTVYTNQLTNSLKSRLWPTKK